MLIGYKFRIYPNKRQEELIQKTFGCARFVYNQCLAYKINKYKNENISLSKFDCNNYCNQKLKKEYEWLREVDKFALTNSIYNMDSAFQKFFKEGKGFPKFKSKKNNKNSYKTNNGNLNSIEVDFENNKVKLPKLKWIKCKLHRKFNGNIKSANIYQTHTGKYFISILVDTNTTPIKNTNEKIGIDLGIKHLVVTSKGEKFDNIRVLKKYETKIIKEQRKLSRKKKDSNNYNKQKIKVAKLYEKVKNIRLDNLHKISHKLISENQVIVSENLAISNMTKNHNLAKAILDCGWYEFTRQLQYKADWNNRQYIKIDRFSPSSQICNICGYKNLHIKNLSVREWVCPQCGAVHDRDINAAINILNEGLKLLK